MTHMKFIAAAAAAAIAGIAQVSSAQEAVQKVDPGNLQPPSAAQSAVRGQNLSTADVRAPTPVLSRGDIAPPSASGGALHLGRLWVTPVMIQKKGGASGPAGVARVTAEGATVTVRGRDGKVVERGGSRDGADRKAEAAEIQRRLQQEQQKQQETDDVGSSQQGLIAGDLSRVQQFESAEERAGERANDSVQRAEIDVSKDREAERSERRVCERRPRNAWETFTSWFGAKHTEECPSSVRRRVTTTTDREAALGVKNTLYFINLSAREAATVEVACRIRDQSTLLVANVAVAPMDFSEWEPPCACEQDYKIWCTVTSDQPIAAHAIATQSSAGRETMEYIDFFLAR